MENTSICISALRKWMPIIKFLIFPEEIYKFSKIPIYMLDHFLRNLINSMGSDKMKMVNIDNLLGIMRCNLWSKKGFYLGETLHIVYRCLEIKKWGKDDDVGYNEDLRTKSWSKREERIWYVKKGTGFYQSCAYSIIVIECLEGK